jgi:hypothetical protein
MNESTNKYVLAFRESCKKLEEDDGNPSLMQAMDYDMDNYDLIHDEELSNEFRKITLRLNNLKNEIFSLANKYNNLKLKKLGEKLENVFEEILKERDKGYDFEGNNEFRSKHEYLDGTEYHDEQNADHQYPPFNAFEEYPNDNKVKNTNPSIQEILDGNYEI